MPFLLDLPEKVLDASRSEPDSSRREVEQVAELSDCKATLRVERVVTPLAGRQSIGLDQKSTAVASHVHSAAVIGFGLLQVGWIFSSFSPIRRRIFFCALPSATTHDSFHTSTAHAAEFLPNDIHCPAFRIEAGFHDFRIATPNSFWETEFGIFARGQCLLLLPRWPSGACHRREGV